MYYDSFFQFVNSKPILSIKYLIYYFILLPARYIGAAKSTIHGVILNGINSGIYRSAAVPKAQPKSMPKNLPVCRDTSVLLKCLSPIPRSQWQMHITAWLVSICDRKYIYDSRHNDILSTAFLHKYQN